MALNKITFEDKVALNPQPSVANKNKVSDADMNEIKSVVNAGIDSIESNSTYSTSEIVIGTYNGKPLYRNEIKFTTVSGAKSVSIPNLDKAINLSGFIRGQGNQFPPNIYVSSSFEFHTWVYGTTLWNNCTGYVGYEADLFLEYTKTTD